MKTFENKQAQIDFVKHCVESASAIIDNRFAVINGFHFEMIEYQDVEDQDQTFVISTYKAEEYSNLSITVEYANAQDVVSDDALITIEVFHDIDEANTRFLALIKEQLENF
jgi:hypothetical protein